MDKDKILIDNFIKQNIGKEIVVVQGLGFVGAVMSLVVANSVKNEYAVIGVDIPSKRNIIDNLNEGVFPIESTDHKVNEYFENSKIRGNFFATDDIYAYSLADYVIIDINLDVQKKSGRNKELLGYEVNLDWFKKAISVIAENCKEDVLILVETTVPPGTCNNLIKPIFEDIFNKRGLNQNFKISHSYERVMPGPGYIDSIKNFYRVYSGIDEASADKAEVFLKTIISTDQYPLTRLKNTNASEMSKVLENSFRAMNIAFMQEWTEFAEKAEVDLHEVVNAIRMRPTHKNIMKPGIGVGGYCLTKDPLLASWAAQNWFGINALAQSEKAVAINDSMPLHSFNSLNDLFKNELSGKNILILGVSYLQNVGDTRYTPIELLVDKLIEQKVNFILHDPFIEFWDYTSIKVSKDEDILKMKIDGIILGTPHDYYIKGVILDEILATNLHLKVIDPHGMITQQLKNKYNGKHEFRTIGVGK